MKRIITVVALLVAGLAVSQDMAPVPKDELRAVDFLMGKANADLTFTFGGTAMKGPGNWDAKLTLGGRFIQSAHTYSMEGQTVEGLHLLTYDAAKKKYVGWWYDSSAPTAMRMEGDLKDGTLVLVSEPVELPGMPGKTTMRATYAGKDGKVGFALEMRQGDAWVKLIEGTYTRG